MRARGHGWRAGAVSVLAGLTLLSAARADVAALQKEIVEQRESLLDANGRIDGLNRLGAVLDAAPTAGAAPDEARFVGHPKLWESIVAQFRTGEQARLASLEPLVAGVEARRKQAVAAWRVLANGSIASELDAAPDPVESGTLGPNLLFDLLPIAGWCVLAVLGSLLVLAYEQRLELRWWLRSWVGGAGMLLAFASALQLIGCSPAPSSGWEPPDTAAAADVSEEALAKTLAELKKEVQKAGRKAAEQEAAIKAREAAVARARVAEIVPISATKGTDPAEELRRIEGEAQAKVRELLVAAGQAVAFSEDGARAIEELKGDWDARRQALEAARTRAFLTGGLGFGGSLLGVGLAFLPVARVRRARRRRAELVARQCPRCLDSELETVTSGISDIHGRGLQRVECKNPSCLYWFNASYRTLSRLCFPTLGIKDSGKTRWMLTIYEMVRNSNLPHEVRVSLDILSSQFDEVFDHMIRVCLETHAVTSPTQFELPFPRIFFHRDRDLLGKHQVLVNLFDYSGETMFAGLSDAIQNSLAAVNTPSGGVVVSGSPVDAVGAMRRRALLSDSFVLFLDPTQVLAGGGYSINDQIKAVNEFINDLRVVRDLRPGKRIDLSIAVCISKIDLLTTRNPMGGFAEDWVRMLRQSAQYPPSLALIHQRSRFCAQALRSMFPGWDVERTLRANFGTRFMFFPLTPVGIEEGELGVESLDQRIRAPFGVLEPLLWLLHMHGYSVFGGRPGS